MKLAVSCITRRPWMVQNVVDNILRQTRRPDLAVMVNHGVLPIPYAFIDAMEEEGIYYICDAVPASYSSGKLDNHAKGRAVKTLQTGFVCSWDDDDYFGANYLAEMENAALEHPDAWLLGKAQFPVRWVGGVRDGVTEMVLEKVYENNRAPWLAGPTISVNAELWREHPGLRYVDMGIGNDARFLQTAGTLFLSEHPDLEVPIYHVPNAEFILQRYADPQHNHDWNWAHDREPVLKEEIV